VAEFDFDVKRTPNSVYTCKDYLCEVSARLTNYHVLGSGKDYYACNGRDKVQAQLISTNKKTGSTAGHNNYIVKCQKGVLQDANLWGYNPMEFIPLVKASLGGIGVWTPLAGLTAKPELVDICIIVSDSMGVELENPFSCFTTPIINDISCSVSNNLTFNHGNVLGSAIDNHMISMPVSVNCTGATDVNLKIGPSINDPSGSISMGGGITSEFSINSAKIDSSGVDENLKSGVNTINITSKLKSSGKPSAGKYSGSGILYINTQ
jgi:hypothetical protein